MNQLTKDMRYMREALTLAKYCDYLGEAPVGAIIVKNDAIISKGMNRRELKASPSEHAEINAINNACRVLGNWRLNDTTLYSTLEPCIMCAGAILHARINRVVFGTADEKFGAIVSLYELGKDDRLNHSFEHKGGILKDECALILKQFFKRVRSIKSTRKTHIDRKNLGK